VRGNPFTYSIVGNAILPSRTTRLIAKSNFQKELLPSRNTADLQHLQCTV
jgi:hypothetical protein